MTETKEPAKEVENKEEQSKEELGILDSYGSFPVWMLKGIELITPDILIDETPPKKPKVRN